MPIHSALRSRPFLLATVTFLSAAVLFFVAGSIPYSWSQWKRAKCFPDNCFCEAIRPATVAQPANTWSCLAFVLAGLFVLALNRLDVSLQPQNGRPSNPMQRQTTYATTYGVALIVIGVGSGFYHASFTVIGGLFDQSGMYLLATFILLYNWSRVSPIRPRRFVVLYTAANALLFNTQVVKTQVGLPYAGRYVFAALILAGLLVERRARRAGRLRADSRYLRLALLSFGVAFVIWTLDTTRVLCAPGSWLQGHALWHLLGAAAAWLLYLYYRSEQQEEIVSTEP